MESFICSIVAGRKSLPSWSIYLEYKCVSNLGRYVTVGVPAIYYIIYKVYNV